MKFLSGDSRPLDLNNTQKCSSLSEFCVNVSSALSVRFAIVDTKDFYVEKQVVFRLKNAKNRFEKNGNRWK